jgi:2-polyprenyl-6-methoxyphenol hydroxylase-like FAD-dependent oxidoreductase
MGIEAAIYHTVENDTEAMYSDSIVGIDERSDGVALTFADASPRDFDLLVGADGLHSRVRQLTFGPDATSARHLGCQVAACVVDGYRPREELVFPVIGDLTINRALRDRQDERDRMPPVKRRSVPPTSAEVTADFLRELERATRGLLALNVSVLELGPSWSPCAVDPTNWAHGRYSRLSDRTTLAKGAMVDSPFFRLR